MSPQNQNSRVQKRSDTNQRIAIMCVCLYKTATMSSLLKSKGIHELMPRSSRIVDRPTKLHLSFRECIQKRLSAARSKCIRESHPRLMKLMYGKLQRGPDRKSHRYPTFLNRATYKSRITRSREVGALPGEKARIRISAFSSPLLLMQV